MRTSKRNVIRAPLFAGTIFLTLLAAGGHGEAGENVFPAGPGREDFRLALAAYWSPDFWQDTGFYPQADFITALDGDGDWIGANNLESLKAGLFEPYLAYVYFVVMETETHYLIIYEVFHPFDYDRPWASWIPNTTHENDTEGVMVIVKKDPDHPFGVFRAFETRPHGYVRYYANDPAIKLRLPKLLETVRLREATHPEVYIQEGGHGPYALGAREHGLAYRNDFTDDTGVVYRYTGAASAPTGPNDREVGYDLIDVSSPRGLWANRCSRETFDNFFVYQPPKGRPGVPPRLTCDGRLPRSIDGDKSGDSRGADSAGVPWRHFTPDPAYHAAREWSFPEPFSTTYVVNPFLGIEPE